MIASTFLLLLAVTGLTIVAEIFKSTVAVLRDYIQPRHDNLITESKDMALGALWVAVHLGGQYSNCPLRDGRMNQNSVKPNIQSVEHPS